MKRVLTHVTIGICSLLLWLPLEAQGDEFKYTSRHQMKSNQQLHGQLYGYYPYYFSNDLRFRYAYTAEEKGHYILGVTDESLPFPKSLKEIESIEPIDLPEVYISTSLSEHKILPKVFKNRRDIKERVNDSQDLDRVIAASKWNFRSKEMKKLLRD